MTNVNETRSIFTLSNKEYENHNILFICIMIHMMIQIEMRLMRVTVILRIKNSELSPVRSTLFTSDNYWKRKGDLPYFPQKVERWLITVLVIVRKLTAPNNAPKTS